MAGTLTPKQLLFVAEYLVDLNATQAAIRAGYSPKTANEQACRLLANVNIQAAVQRRQRELSKCLDITQERVLRELAAIGFSNTAEYVQVCGGRVAIADTDSLSVEKQAALASIKEGRNGIEVKLHDKVRALELLAKHLGLLEGRKDETDNGELLTLIAGLKEDGHGDL